MALRNQSLFLYGFEITENNSSLDFRAVLAGPIIQVTLRLGFYSLTSLLEEIVRAMTEADPTREYTATADRTANGGLENRVTISTNGTYLDLLFGSGPRVATSIGTLLGFPVSDKTGALTYTGSTSAGTVLVSDRAGYNFLSTAMQKQVQGSENVSASGEIEAVVFQVMPFWQVQFKYEPESAVILAWAPLMEWMIAKKLIEFTPDISTPSVFYEGTLAKTAADAKGMAYKWTEMLPDFPFNYDTGLMTFRVRLGGANFI